MFILFQVQFYVDPWPEAQWGHRDLSSICVMASSKSQVMCCYLINNYHFNIIYTHADKINAKGA